MTIDYVREMTQVSFEIMANMGHLSICSCCFYCCFFFMCTSVKASSGSLLDPYEHVDLCDDVCSAGYPCILFQYFFYYQYYSIIPYCHSYIVIFVQVTINRCMIILMIVFIYMFQSIVHNLFLFLAVDGGLFVFTISALTLGDLQEAKMKRQMMTRMLPRRFLRRRRRKRRKKRSR